MKPIIPGLTNGLINVVDAETGLQLRASTADPEIARQLRADILEGKFSPDQISVKRSQRTIKGKTVRWPAIAYKGNIALWLNGDNGRLDPAYEQQVVNQVFAKIRSAETRESLVATWNSLAKTYGPVNDQGEFAAFSNQLNHTIVALFKAAAEQTQ